MSTLPDFAEEEVEKHKFEDDCWVIVDGAVYDVTPFLNEHPGGKKILLKEGGKDATKVFHKFHEAAVILRKYEHLKIGTLKKSEIPIPQNVIQNQHPREFGELIPYGDPSWYQRWHSPYYNDSHKKFRQYIRGWVDKHIVPYCEEWENKRDTPVRQLLKQAYEDGLINLIVGLPWNKQYCGETCAGGTLKAEEIDEFHGLIFGDEMSRPGYPSASGGWMIGLCIGLPCVLMFGSSSLKERIAKPCMQGEKVICLAITEPGTGSDVAQITCTAKKSPCGKFYIVNGEKKWITNGIYADYFTTAVRTGKPGADGITMMVIPRGPGVTTRKMDCSGMWASGTTYITFEDVKVPVENVVGAENQGFMVLMYNFTKERISACVQINRLARVCLEESIKYSMERKTFGKRLCDHPIIREKLSNMARQVEATHALIELAIYQGTKMSHMEALQTLGGSAALLKAHTTRVLEYCQREASQIFGGKSFTRGGQGGKVECLGRESRAYNIFAGSEEIMLDQGMKMALSEYEKRMKRMGKL